jgi:hypothetical protein
MTPPGEKIEQASPATPLNCKKSFKYPARRKLREAKLMQHFFGIFQTIFVIFASAIQYT